MINIIKAQMDAPLREAREAAVKAGRLPDFRPESAGLRSADWSVAAPSGSGAGPAHYLAGVRSAGEAEAWWRSRTGLDGPVILWLDSVWAAFEVEEILYALKNGVSKVECDNDGYLFSIIETFRELPEFVLPDRADITPNTHLLRSFARLTAGVCRRRGAAFDEPAPDEPMQRDRIEAADLLLVPRGRITERGIRRNIRTALAYLAGSGEPGARDEGALLRAWSAARLAAAQLWQWVRHETGVLDEGRIVTGELFEILLNEELDRHAPGEGVAAAGTSLADTVLSESFTMQAFFEPASGSEVD